MDGAQPLPTVVPVPLVVTAEPPEPLTGGGADCVGADDPDDDGGGVLLTAGDVVAVLWVGVVVLCTAALLLAFLAGRWRTTSLEGDGTVAIEVTVALLC